MKRPSRMAPLLIVALLIAACGDGGETATTGDTATTVVDAATTMASETTAASETTEPPGELRQITVVTESPCHVCWAHTFVADALGYYADEGLEVEILSNLPGGTLNDALFSGQVDFAGQSQNSMIEYVYQNPDTLRWFLIDNNYPFQLMVLEGSEVTEPQDLVGSLIGMPETSDITNVEFIMATAGIGADEYDTVPTGGRAALGVALIDGQVDAAMGTYVDEAAMVNDAGADVVVLRSGMPDMHDGGYAARVETIENDPELVVGFGRAIAKGTIWMFENPEATIDILADTVPEAITDRDEAIALRLLVNDANGSLYESKFETNIADWQTVVDARAETGLVDESFPAEQLITFDFLEEIWDFDVEAIVDDARNDRR